MYVLDASVLYKWFADERDSRIAIKIKEAYKNGEFILAIPDLALYEVANALRYKPEFSVDDIRRCCLNLYELELDIVAPVPELFESAAKLAYQFNITIYDAVYITLAQQMELRYITADEKLYERVKDLPSVNLLSKLKLT